MSIAELEHLPMQQLAGWLRETLIELVTILLARQVPDVQPRLTSFVLQTVLTVPHATEDNSAFRKLVDDLINDPAFPEATWRMITEREIAQLIGMPDFKGLPTALWELVGLYAWRDLAFQAELAERIEMAIRQRTLFQVGEFQTMLIAPNTCWLLLALACAHTLQSTTALDKAPKAVRRGLNAAPLLRGASQLLRSVTRWVWNRQNPMFAWMRLFWQRLPRLLGRQRPLVERLRPEERRVLQLMQAKGEQFGLRTGWAGVWDQWLLLEALRYWHVDVTPIRDALQALPLHRHRPDNMSQDGPASAAALEHPAWADQLERWFIEWNHMETTL